MNLVTVILMTFAFLVGAVFPALAQVSGETETGSNARGGSFASEYVFYDWNRANLLTRYFWVNDAVNRGEVAFGPTFRLGGTTVKLQFGGTTNRAAMVAGLAVGKLVERQVMYIGDLKVSTTGTADEFYQKLFVALDRKTVWQFRIESLNIDDDLAFLRIGGEYQLQFSPKRHLYFAPFYDPIIDSPGAQIGFRFF